MAVYKVELEQNIGDALARKGRIHPSVADQHGSVERALKRLISDFLKLEP